MIDKKIHTFYNATHTKKPVSVEQVVSSSHCNLFNPLYVTKYWIILQLDVEISFIRQKDMTDPGKNFRGWINDISTVVISGVLSSDFV